MTEKSAKMPKRSSSTGPSDGQVNSDLAKSVSTLQGDVQQLQQVNQQLHTELQQAKSKGYDLFIKLDDAYANHQQAIKVIVSVGEKLGVKVEDGKINFGQVLDAVESLTAKSSGSVSAE
ncbi:hypothetical protein [Pseudoalteromonas sp. ASV78]|uniref:hypothetical protein n=1 Tax=Pseudoalteromonas sp. ASV78 TaxID=3397851 RepID=UPI0039FD07F4